MSFASRIVIAVVLAVAIGAVLVYKARESRPADTAEAHETPREAGEESGEAPLVPAEPASEPPEPEAQSEAKGIPKLVDLGADKCIPCQMMAPILEELKEEYAGRMEVQIIDVWKNPDAGKKYGIQMIPTQIFFDVSGKELTRHTGFLGKEDILAKWKEFGIEFAAPEDASAQRPG